MALSAKSRVMQSSTYKKRRLVFLGIIVKVSHSKGVVDGASHAQKNVRRQKNEGGNISRARVDAVFLLRESITAQRHLLRVLNQFSVPF
jgi:hypothetical protein